MLELSLIIVALAILVIAAYVDIKTLEVPDWLNYVGVGAGLGIHLLFSLQQWSWWPMASSVIGFGLAFGLACLMFYTGQWGGGDAKLLMALGAVIGFEANKFGFGTGFLVNLVLVGGLWGVLWSLVLAIRNGRKFLKTFKAIRHQKQYRKLRIMSLLIAAGFIIASLLIPELQIEIIGLAAATYVLSYLAMFVKSVELSCLHKWVTPDKLTEGDWLVHAVKVGNKEVIPPKLGLEKKHVRILNKLYKEKKIQKVLVKYGVPFAPAFLLAFIATMLFNNILLSMLL